MNFDIATVGDLLDTLGITSTHVDPKTGGGARSLTAQVAVFVTDTSSTFEGLAEELMTIFEMKQKLRELADNIGTARQIR